MLFAMTDAQIASICGVALGLIQLIGVYLQLKVKSDLEKSNIKANRKLRLVKNAAAKSAVNSTKAAENSTKAIEVMERVEKHTNGMQQKLEEGAFARGVKSEVDKESPKNANNLNESKVDGTALIVEVKKTVDVIKEDVKVVKEVIVK